MLRHREGERGKATEGGEEKWRGGEGGTVFKGVPWMLTLKWNAWRVYGRLLKTEGFVWSHYWGFTFENHIFKMIIDIKRL